MITKLSGVPNFHHVAYGLYRSGQPTNLGYQSLRSAQFHTIVDLCGSWECVQRGEPDAYIRDFEYHNIPLDGTLAHIKAADLMRVVETLIYAPKPALVHCLRGADRTGAVVAAYRIMAEHMSSEDAIKEMKLEKYEWSYLYGGANIEHQLNIIEIFLT
jgi:tyrosine-protein phosphatase SIW14